MLTSRRMMYLTISEEMVKTINELREKFNCLVIADEVQTGVGRLGTFLGSSKYGLNVDIVSLAKAVGGGLPLGVVLMRSHVAEMLKPGDHGTTFGGNPLACAAGLAVVNEVLSAGFLSSVSERSKELKAGLAKLAEKYSFLGNVHGDGLLLGIETEKPVAELIASARENGLLVHRAGANVRRLLPPLNVSKEEVEEALSILDKACSLVS